MSATIMIRAAQEIDFNCIKTITQTTIWSIYPKYYPKGAVQFFSDYHSDERIKTDIGSGKVFLIEGEEVIIGTVTVIDNEINRLFVLPDYQGKGYGGALMDFAEEMIGRNYDHIILDASLPGKQMYIKRNYVVKKYDMIETENGDYLCYDTMEKFM